MQPFSLLPFLQTLINSLPDANKKTDEPPKAEQNNAPSAGNAQIEKEMKENACWQFFAQHDERVRRTKKP